MPEDQTGTRLRDSDPVTAPLDDAGSPFLEDHEVDDPPRPPAPPDHTGSVPVIRHARDVGDDHGPGFLTRLVAIVLAVLIGVAGRSGRR